jgi:hypothetical protein
MKTCPTCNRSYTDDTLSFCLHDGSVLVSSTDDPQATQRIPVPPNTTPSASTLVYPNQGSSPQAQAPPPQLQYGAWAEPQNRSSGGGGKVWLAVGGIVVVLLLVAAVGLGIILNQAGWFGGNNSQNSSFNADNKNARGSERSNNTSNTAPRPTPTPTPDVPVAEALGLVGNWGGSQNGRPASLTIVSEQGNAFSGTKFQGVNQVSFVGTIDPVTRRITVRETKLLKGTPYTGKSGWSLASETGVLSADGRKMSGTGSDEYTRKTPYTWSYTRKK